MDIIKFMSFLFPNYEEKLMKVIHAVNNGGTLDDLDTIVDDYFYLIKKIRRKHFIRGNPKQIELKDSLLTVYVDGMEYDFNSEIHHNDGKGTECKLEIETLSRIEWNNLIQERLTEKFAKNGFCRNRR